MGDDPGDNMDGNGFGNAYTVMALLIGGMFFWGGIGWLFDHWLGTHLLLPLGLIAGGAGGIYLVIKRFGGQ